jgi:quercetin 2,3-dioxygenase
MSFEYLKDPAQGPAWRDLLPGAPEAYFLARGEGEHAKLFGDLFTVLVSGNETNGKFGMIHCEAPPGPIIPTHAHEATHETFYVIDGAVRIFVQYPDGQKTSRLLEPGDFGYVPAGLAHAYRVEAPTRLLGVLSGGFERFSSGWAPSPTPPSPASRRSSRTWTGSWPRARSTTPGSCPTSAGPRSSSPDRVQAPDLAAGGRAPGGWLPARGMPPWLG